MKQLKKVLTGNLGSAALMLLAVGLLLSYVAGWCVGYGVNTDYTLSVMLRGGETRLPYLSIFISAPLAALQRLFGTFNVFSASQLFCCVAAMLTLNYVFFAKLGKRAGAVIAGLSDVLLYSACVLTVQFFYTSALLTAAGALLLLYAHYSAPQGKLAWFQRILGGVMMLIGSLYSVSAFLYGAVFAALTVLCMLVKEVLQGKKPAAVLKRNAIFLISFVLIFAVGFGADVISEAVKRRDAAYAEAARVIRGRELISEGSLAPFAENEDFYREHNIYSEEELLLLESGVTDTSLLSGEDVEAVGEMALKHRLGGSLQISHAVKSTFRRAVGQLKARVISDYLAVRNLVNSKVAAIAIAALGAALLAALLILWLIMRKKHGWAPLIYGGIPHKIAKLALAALWVLFFIVYPISFPVSMLAPCAVFTILTLRSANARHTAVCWLFSLPVMALYTFQSCYFITFRFAFIFAVPAFLCMAYLYDFNNMENLLQAKPLARSVAVTLALVLAITMTANLEVTVWKKGFGTRAGSYPQTITNYIKKHSDETFALTTAACQSIDPNFGNALWLSALPENTLKYGGWSGCYAQDDVFAFLAKDGAGRLAIKRGKQNVVPYYEALLNNHYAPKGEKLRLEGEKTFTVTGKFWGGSKPKETIDIYRIVKE